MKSLILVCCILGYGVNSVALSKPLGDFRTVKFPSKFGQLAVSNCGRFITDWQQFDDGSVQGELTLLSASNKTLSVVKIEQLKISLPTPIIGHFGERIVLVQPTQDGAMLVFESVNNYLKQVASVDVADAKAKVVGFTSKPDEVVCELTEKLVLINWRTSEIQVLVGRQAAYSNAFCNESDRFLLFPGATKECGRIETLFRQRENAINVTTNVLPGLGGTSGSTPRGPALAQDYAIVEFADFENSSGLTAALAIQVGAGFGVFLWKGDVLIDIARMPDLDKCSALRIHANELHCIFHFPGVGARHESWTIDSHGLVPLKSALIGSTFRNAKLNSKGRVVLVDFDGKTAQLEVEAEAQED